ncbi:hypothetical protein RRG08_026829 [Elysia crispata]|uniref:DDE Tnp4 domain-containing protein n=1 Tax=Elysia crispata TaxID=231223 RepID=A0AAE0ZHH1_9GAST|nr:hypothetical protein RRG08_026829 [Elysia crispata]
MEVPFVFLADDAFPLSDDILKPFAQRQLTDTKFIFNCRLSRAGYSVECSFGRISQKWRILQRQSDEQPLNAINIVKAVTTVHSFVVIHEPRGLTSDHRRRTNATISFS